MFDGISNSGSDCFGLDLYNNDLVYDLVPFRFLQSLPVLVLPLNVLSNGSFNIGPETLPHQQRK